MRLVSIRLRRSVKLYMKRRIVIVLFLLAAWVLYYVYSVYDSIVLYFNPHDTPDWPSAAVLPRLISRAEYDTYMDLLVSFLDHCLQANITVVAWGGTLVGAYMFHDLVPWDDDLDLMIPYTHLPKLKRHFRDEINWRTHSIKSSNSPYWEMDLDTLLKFPEDTPDTEFYRDSPGGQVHTGHSFKYFRPNTGSNKWQWPYLDIILYHENSTHVWSDEEEHSLFMKRDKFYPFVTRAFGRVWLKSPADTGHVLRRRYGKFVCENHRTIHRHGQSYSWFLRKRVNCRQIWNIYPQVWSEPLYGNIEIESLKLGSKVLHKFRMQHRTKLDQPSERPFDF